MPPNVSASLLMNIIILDFHCWPNANCSEFRVPMTQLYKVFQLNVSISLDLCSGHHKMCEVTKFLPLDKNVECPQTFLLHY